ncbi:hypothetical protein FRC08_017116, partial [Ceratobasidium sp. 394]
MGVPALSMSHLLFFRHLQKGDRGVYNMLPFTNPVWREICGFESIEGDFEWKFKPAVWRRFSVRQKGIFSEKNIEKITTFLSVILERSKQGGDSWLNRLDNVSGFHEYQDAMLVLLT